MQVSNEFLSYWNLMPFNLWHTSFMFYRNSKLSFDLKTSSEILSTIKLDTNWAAVVVNGFKLYRNKVNFLQKTCCTYASLFTISMWKILPLDFFIFLPFCYIHLKSSKLIKSTTKKLNIVCLNVKMKEAEVRN